MKLYNLHTPPKSCSLIITTYNQKERLALVLDSVRNLKILPDEVLIADDGSKGDTKEMIESYMSNFPCPLRHIWQEDKGFRAALSRNNAINNAKGEYIIIIDGDMILESHFVSDHLRFAKKGVLAQGSRVILNENESKKILESKDYTLAFRKRSLKSRRSGLLSQIIYHYSTLNADFFNNNELIKGVRSCNMSFHKCDFESIGGGVQREIYRLGTRR